MTGMQMVLLLGYIATGGLTFAATAMVLGFLCMIYDRESFGGREIGVMIFIAGVCGLIAGGIFGIMTLVELQQAIPAVQAGGGTWV